ncbi:MAG: AMP-binding protein [Sphingobium sp.]
MSNRAESLFQRERSDPDGLAIMHEGAALSFHQLAEGVRDTAGRLAARGVVPGMHIGVLLRASPTFIVVQQALFALGAIVTPLNILYRSGEIRHAVTCCDLAMIVTSDDLAAALDGDPGCPCFIMDCAEGSRREGSPEGAGPLPLAPVEEEDTVMLLLTSATTGKAKGVMLTAGNLAANYDRTPAWLGLDRQDVILCALPLYNTFGLNQCINAMLVTGCRMVLMPRFDAAQCIAMIAGHRCTFLPAVPTMLQKIIDHPAAGRDTLGSLRKVMTGGAPVPTPLLKRLLDLAPGVELYTGYGLTEASALVTLQKVEPGADGAVARDRTIGRALDGIELRIRSEEGAFLGPNESGEIVVRGANVMKGYHAAPRDNAMAIRDGWLHTGDIGYLDEEGYAFIVDRKKDVIIRGGQNIYPAEIEEVLYRIPGVAEAAVVGMPDALLGEVPVAFVACTGKGHPQGAAMAEHCRLSLAGYKLPVAIHILPELPKGPTGKILRRALKPDPSMAA